MAKIRKFSPEDLDRVMEINQGSFARPWPRESFNNFYRTNPDGFVLAEEGRSIAGFSLNKISGDKAGIKLIAVDTSFRERGIGKSLVEYAFSQFGENGVREVTARSRINNENGQKFLRSFGFETVKTVKNYYSDGGDAYLMVKKL